ncbi:CidA/LrgA family protein [Bacillus sp. 03113]|uniref:CidA/LrgA family protein n=1 Tax=Bacillus sp. 03113 TaxID=2578211 RepID=UPI0011419035|nr:CidA/LrgA family holin-like protein [Bacillus sp. 03113]
MKLLKICVQILLLYGFLLVGEWLQHLLNISISGSIIGMILLFIALTFKIIPEKWIAQGSGFLISIISLLLVPSLSGLIQFPILFSKLGLMLLITIILSTILMILSGGWTSQFLGGKRKGAESNGAIIKSSHHNRH